MPRPKGEDAKSAIEASRWLELRASGLTYRQIAESTSYSYETVRRRVTKYLEEHPVSNASNYRVIQLAGYDRLLRALSPGVDQGDTRSIGETRKILEAQARLLGLNAATKTELTVEHKEDPAVLQMVELQRQRNLEAREAMAMKALPIATVQIQDAELVEDQ